jgi:hypothetical protein
VPGADGEGEKPVDRLTTIAFWWNLAVVACFAGTAIAGYFTWRYTEAIGAAKDRALRQFQAESRTAVALADAKGAEANRQAANANERAAALELESAIQRERAAKAEQALLELQHRLAWRDFAPAQAQGLVHALRPFRGVSVSVMVMVGEAEAERFGQQLVSLLRAADWSATISTTGMLLPPPYGIICWHPAGDKPAEALIRSLKSFGLQVSEENGDTLRILVGLKPPVLK